MVHRDIKSENVFRTSSGQWKLGDFGSALRLGDEKALNRQPWKLEGTFSFAPPEYIMIWNGFTRRDLFNATSFKVCLVVSSFAVSCAFLCRSKSRMLLLGAALPWVHPPKACTLSQFIGQVHQNAVNL